MRHVPLDCLSFEKHALRLMQTERSVHLSWEVLLLHISWQCFARVLHVEFVDVPQGWQSLVKISRSRKVTALIYIRPQFHVKSS